MNKNIIKDSIVAGRDVTGGVNAKNSDVSNEVRFLRKARTQSFWISLIVGVVSSLIASYLFHLLVN
jgi:hypothetical protein